MGCQQVFVVRSAVGGSCLRVRRRDLSGCADACAAVREIGKPARARRRAELAEGRPEEDARAAAAPLVEGALDTAEFSKRKVTCQVEIEAWRKRCESPAAELDAWRKAVTRLLDFGATLERRFRDGTDDEKRTILTRLCSDLVVTNRKTELVLREELCILALPRPKMDTEIEPFSNYLEAPNSSLTQTKNARVGCRRSRANIRWW